MTKEEVINQAIQSTSPDTNLISDGYHTFGELYEHRIALFIALCNHIYLYQPTKPVWKSRVHFDGTSLDGWFIAGIGLKNGEQITYHLPEKDWDKLRIVAYDKAPVEWDGHMSADVIKRLLEL